MRALPGLPLITAYRSCPNITGFAFDSLNANRAFLLVPVSEARLLTQLNAAGTSFGYSTYFGSAGGSGTTTIYGLATNTSGDVFVTGTASIPPGGAFPATTTAFQGYTSYSAFVSRISSSTAPCSVVIAPGSQTITGDSVNLGLSAIAPSGCAWSAVSNQSWATITRGATDTGVDGITIQVAANNSGATRTATIMAGGASSTIIQADSSCNFTLSNYSFNLPSGGGSISASVTAAAGCPWTVTNPFPSVTIKSGSSGTGNGTINATVGTNYAPEHRVPFYYRRKHPICRHSGGQLLAPHSEPPHQRYLRCRRRQWLHHRHARVEFMRLECDRQRTVDHPDWQPVGNRERYCDLQRGGELRWEPVLLHHHWERHFPNQPVSST